MILESQEALFSIAGKRVLLTGASSGIGAVIARQFAAAGAIVYGVGRNEERLKQVFSSLKGGGHQYYVYDLSCPDFCEELIKRIAAVDAFVHSAGVCDVKPVRFLKESDCRKTMSINFDAAVWLSKALFKGRKIQKGGSIVFISSVSSVSATIGHSIYAASKAALESFARCLALETAAKKIRVNSVCPGMIQTEMIEDLEEIIGEDAISTHAKEYPLGLGKPEDVANAVNFLVSDASGWITGTSMLVDGGFSLR